MTKQFDANRQEVRTEINKNLDEAKKAKEAGTLSEAEFDKKQQQLQTLGILVDSISAGLSAPTTSGLGIAAATASPTVSYEIGQFSESKDAEGSAIVASSGSKEVKDLTADEKETVSAITGLVASGVGASTGDVASTVHSRKIGVENNAVNIDIKLNFISKYRHTLKNAATA